MSKEPYCKAVQDDTLLQSIASITTFAPLPCLDGQMVDVALLPDERSPVFVPLTGVPMAGVVAQLLDEHTEQLDKRANGIIFGECAAYRAKGAVRTVSAIALDIDDGVTEEEVMDALDKSGVAYTLYNSHSHGRTMTVAEVEKVRSWLRSQRNVEGYDAVSNESLSAYLGVDVTRFVATRGKHDEEATYYECEHAPLVKFRVVIYLRASIPITGDDGVTWTGFKRLYSRIAEALLGADIAANLDSACNQPGRVFFLPAKPPRVERGHRIVHHNGALLDWRPHWDAIREQVAEGARRAAERRAEMTERGDYGADLDKVRACLQHIPADDHGTWFRVVAAIHYESQGSEAGHTLAHKWSATSDKYDEDGVERIWDEFDSSEPDKPATIGTLVRLARETEPGFSLPSSSSPRTDEERRIALCKAIGRDATPTVSSDATGDDDAALTGRLLADAADKAALTVSYNSDTQSFDTAKRFVKGQDGKLTPVWTLLASPIIIDGVGYTDDHKEATLILRIRTETGRWNRIAIPRSELTGGPQLMAKLKGMGLRTSAPAELVTLLSVVEPSRRVVTAKQPGWSGDAFVLPSGEVIGSTDVVPVFEPVKGFDVAGSRDEADAMLSAIEHQSRLVFAAAASLAAPLYTRHGIEPGGINLAGKSSGGKTTTLAVALSMWGRGDLESRGGLIGSANTTAFAAEVRASKVNNLVMSADEIKTASPETVETLLYTIPNGASRAAGRADGGLREQRQFSVMLVMTGEMTARAYLEQHKIPYNAGMAVRILDIPADAGAGLGVFDSVPAEFSSAGAVADWIKEQSRAHYGHHGRALLESYVADVEGWTRDLMEASQMVRNALDLAPGVDPQIGRVASRVAFIGTVAIVAAMRGIVPWQVDSIDSAVSKVFADWMALRGGSGSLEVIDAERAFTNYIQTNPGAFDIRGTTSGPDRRRCGVKSWYEAADGRRYPEYLIHSEESFVEMLGGQAERLEPFLRHLKSDGSEDWAIRTGAGRDKIDSPKGLGLPKRCYCIRSKQPQDIELDEPSNDNKTPVAPATCFG